MRQSKKRKSGSTDDCEPPPSLNLSNINMVSFHPTPGSPLVEELQQLAAWLTRRLAQGSPVLGLECTLPASSEGRHEYVEALHGLLRAVQGASLAYVWLICSLGSSQQGIELDCNLLQLPHLQVLKLLLSNSSAVRAVGLPRLAGSLQQLSNLTCLDLEGCDVHTRMPDSLAQLCVDGAIFSSGISHLTRLTSLTLRGTRCPEQLPPSLRVLSLGPHCSVAASADGAGGSGSSGLSSVLHCVPQLPNLKLVHSSCGAAAAGGGGGWGPSLGERLELSALSCLSALTSLELCSCGLEGDVEAGLEALQGLRELSMERCRFLGSPGLGLPRLTALKSLTLRKTNLAHLCICHLEALELVSVSHGRILASLIMRGLPSLRRALLRRLPKLDVGSMFLEGLPKDATLVINAGVACFSDSDSEGEGYSTDGSSDHSDSEDDGSAGSGDDDGWDCQGYGAEVGEGYDSEEGGGEEEEEEAVKEKEGTVKRLLHF